MGNETEVQIAWSRKVVKANLVIDQKLSKLKQRERARKSQFKTKVLNDTRESEIEIYQI